MTVVYPYFRYINNKEKYNSYVYYYFGPADEPLRRDQACLEMGNSVNAFRGSGGQQKTEIHGRKPESEKMKKNTSCCGILCYIHYVVVCILIILLCLSEIAVAIITALATKMYSSDLSGRLVAMLILAITAAVALSMVVYAIVAVCRKQAKPVHAASVVLIILAIIQAIVVGVSVRVTAEDEAILSSSLAESFRQSREDNPRHLKMWHATQNSLKCCGVYGPEDYRPPRIPGFFPPDVSISCCPSYDPDRSELVQERAREICKAKKEFYEIGCKNPVLEVLNETATMVISTTVVLILLEIYGAVIGIILIKKQCLYKKKPDLEFGKVVVASSSARVKGETKS